MTCVKMLITSDRRFTQIPHLSCYMRYIFIFCYLILPLHYILEANILVITQLHDYANFRY